MAAKKKSKAKTKTKSKAKAAQAAPVKTIKSRYSKTQLLEHIMGDTELSRKQVNAVLDSLTNIIEGHIRKAGCGEFALPGLLKIKTKKIPARKAKKNVPNPFRPGEFMDVAARPATIRVKILPLKKVKDMAVS